VQYAVGRNPRLHVVARAHSEVDEADLRRLGAARVITAERELGRELVRHTLSRFGVSEREIDVILRRRE
jgi:voltage-gated potassium channel Kch